MEKELDSLIGVAGRAESDDEQRSDELAVVHDTRDEVRYSPWTERDAATGEVPE